MQRHDTERFPEQRTEQLPRTKAVRHTRRVGIAILGAIFIAAGLALVPFPGPWTIPPIIVGLTILSWEFAWAKRLLFQVKRRWKSVKARRAKAKAARKSVPTSPGRKAA